MAKARARAPKKVAKGNPAQPGGLPDLLAADDAKADAAKSARHAALKAAKFRWSVRRDVGKKKS